jgi:hypothetical protein
MICDVPDTTRMHAGSTCKRYQRIPIDERSTDRAPFNRSLLMYLLIGWHIGQTKNNRPSGVCSSAGSPLMGAISDCKDDNAVRSAYNANRPLS